MAERDWANISEDEDDDQYEPQEQAPEEKYQPQPGYSREEYVEDNKPGNQEEEVRTSGYGYGGGGRGDRGYRGGGRGGGRGRGRGGRGGRGDRGDRGDRDRGDRGERGDREDRGERQRPVKESQPKTEMVNLIKRARDDNTFINLFDVDFKANENDIRQLYPEVKVHEVTMVKPGLFLVELDREEALKLVDIGPKKFNQRDFYMKLGYPNKRQNPEEQWHNVNKEKNRFEVGQREDRPKRGGKYQNYNRREQNQFGDEASPRPRYQNENRNRDFQEKKTSEQIDTDNKFFRGHDLKASEFKIRFTNSAKTGEEGSTPQPKTIKPNPFGEAVARDEQEYVKRKDEEKKHVQEMQQHFEEKKEQQQTQPQTQPEIPKEQPILKLTAPVNSVDSQHVPVVEFNNGEGERKGESRRQYEDKGRYDQGGQYGKYKKSGFTGKGQVVYEVKGRDKAAEYYGEDDGQRNRGQGEGKWVPKDRGYGNTNKYNKFDILK